MNSASSSPTPALLTSATTELRSLFEDLNPGDLEPIPQAEPTPPPHWSIGLLRYGLTAVGLVGVTALGLVGGALLAHRYPTWGSNLGLVPSLDLDAVPPLERILRITQGYRYSLQHWFAAAPEEPPLPINAADLDPEAIATLQGEIQGLRSTVEGLEADLAALETQLQVPPSDRYALELEQYLAQIEQALISDSVSPAGTRSPESLQMTLPTDLIFEDGQTTFKSDAELILADLIQVLSSELQAYSLSPTLLIATHTDDVGDAKENLDLSLQRSQVLKDYLAQALLPSTPKPMGWNLVGYGATLPLVDNSTHSNRQRNRRVEFKIQR